MTRMPATGKMPITASEQTDRSSEQEEEDDEYSLDDLEEMLGASIKI